MKKLVMISGLMLAFAITIVACAPATPAAPQIVKETVVVQPTAVAGAEKVTLDTCFSTEPPSFDPSLATDTASIWPIRQMFIGLTAFDEKANVIPSLATEWKASADGLKWTYKIRTNVPWVAYNIATGKVDQLVDKDKKPLFVTTKDVEYGVKRTLSPKTASDYAFLLYVLKGGEEFNTADPKKLGDADLKKLEDAVGVKAVDDATVEFTLKDPAGYFPNITGLWSTFPMYKPIIDSKGDRWTEAGFIVTNGPYTLKEWQHQAKVVMVKNPLWPDAAKVQVEVIQGPVVQSESTCMQMYEKGDIDLMADPGWGPPLPDMDRIKKDAKLSKELFIAPRLCTYYYGFINTKKPFDNPLVRKAFSAAIDRQTLIDTLLKGEQKPAHTFAPPGIFGNASEDMTIAPYLVNYKDGLAKAKDWIKQAGFPDGEGLKVRLGHNVSEAHGQIAQAIQAMWKTAFPKAEIKIETQEFAVYLKTLTPGAPDADKPDIYRIGWCADYPDENNWVNEVFNPKSGQNYSKYNNAKFTQLIEAAAKESDPAKRKDMYAQAEKIFIEDDMGIAPIYYYTYVRLYKPYLTKHPISPVTGDPVAQWEIDWNAKKAARGGK